MENNAQAMKLIFKKNIEIISKKKTLRRSKGFLIVSLIMY